MMAADISETPAFRSGSARELFAAPIRVVGGGNRTGTKYDLSADGNRFLIDAVPARATETAADARITVVLNWQAELKK